MSAWSGLAASPDGGGKLFHDRLDELIDALPELCRHRNGLERVEPQIGVDLLARTLDIRGGQIDFVDHRKELELVLHREIEVRDRLRLDTLGCVDENQRSLARHQRAAHFVGEVDVTRRIDEVQLVSLRVFRIIEKRHRIALDGDPALTLEIHRIENLIAKLAIGDAATALDQPIGQSGLTVVDMCDDAEVANVLLDHGRVG